MVVEPFLSFPFLFFGGNIEDFEGAYDSQVVYQKQSPGIVVASTFVAGSNPQGFHLDCQAILARTTPCDTTL